MIPNAKRFGDKLTNLLATWSTFAPETKLAGMSLAEFKTAMAGSVETREQLDNLRLKIKGLIAERSVCDKAGSVIVARIVAGVLADADLGPNSGFYRALNYIPKDERASGLTRKSTDTSDTDTGDNSSVLGAH